MVRDRIALLDWPTGFGSPGRKPVVFFAIPFFSLAAIFFAARIVVAIAAADGLQIVFYTGGMVVSASFVAGFISTRNVRPDSLPSKMAITNTNSGSALTFPMSRPFTISLLALLVSGTVFLLAYAVSLLLREDHSGAAQLRDYLFATLLIVTAAVMAWMSFHYVRTLRRNSLLVLGPEGIEMDNGSVHQQLSWSEIEGIEAAINYSNAVLIIRPSATKSLRTLRSSIIVRCLSKNYLREMIIDVHFYQIDPALLYHLVNFYWKHPEKRTELTTDAVVTRMRSGELLH